MPVGNESEPRQEQIEYFATHYSISVQHALMPGDQKVYIGAKNARRCRYCGLQTPKTTFRKEAHAVPELIGAKNLIALDECDTCNERFSRTVEDHLAKYLGAMRTICQIVGKGGVPSYKGKDGKSRIKMTASGLEISNYQDDPIIELDPENKRMIVTAHKQPYIPMAVFKSFVKMATAIAPKQDLGDFSRLIGWICDEKHSYESFPYKPLMAMEQFTPGPMPYVGVHLFLLKRQRAEDKVPNMLFIVAFANFLFQIALPMPEKDRHFLDVPVDLVFFPVPFDDSHKYGKTKRRTLDLSSSNIRRGEGITLSVHADTMLEEKKDSPA